jgi:GlpG protein
MRVIETALAENLAPLSGYLWREGIANRVYEERGRQVLEVQDPGHAERARALYAAWREGRIRFVEAPRPAAPAGPRRAGVIARSLRRYPGLTALIALAVLVFPFSVAVGEGGLNPVVSALLIADPHAQVSTWAPWRWLTPIFLHFSIVHLAFNCVVTVELGRRVEGGCGTLAFLLLVGVIGVASNLLQLVFGQSLLFGGLSGVGYGLLGFLLVMARRHPGDVRWRLPQGLALGLLLFLVVFSTGITEPFGLHVANAAHWGGLIAGAVIGLFWAPKSGPARER